MTTYFEDINIRPNKLQELKSKLKGLVAHVASDASSQDLKVKPLEIIDVEMSEPQYLQYLQDFKSELDEKGYIQHMNKYGWGFGQVSTFHTKSFGDCVCVCDKYNKLHCPKILKMYEDAEKIKGKCCFYFRFVDKGVNTMREYLEENGYKLANDSMENIFKTPGKRYIVFTGSESTKQKYTVLKMFNQVQNNYGEYIKYIILSPAGSVGINLGAIRFLGIGSVEYNYSAIRQIMGRCNRFNSHIGLPEKDRTLINKIYISTPNKKYVTKNKKSLSEWYTRTAPNYDEEFPTIERCIYQDSILDDKVNENFREMLKEISIV
jgi:hypothetical protein